MGQTPVPSSGLCDTVPSALTTITTTSSKVMADIIVNNPTDDEQTCSVSGGVSGKVKKVKIPSGEDRRVFKGTVPNGQAIQLGCNTSGDPLIFNMSLISVA